MTIQIPENSAQGNSLVKILLAGCQGVCSRGCGWSANSPAPGKQGPAIQLSSNTVHLEMASDPTVQSFLNYRTAKGIRGLQVAQWVKNLPVMQVPSLGRRVP